MTATGPKENQLRLRVRKREIVAESVVVLELENATQDELPSWEPGAHIDLQLPNGLVRQYSLCGNTGDRSVYRIATLREPAGRGGSAYIFDSLLPDTVVDAAGPRNHFVFHDSPRYVFIAGGIGITPILPMLAAAEAAGAKWELHYGGRTCSSMSFLNDLSELAGDRLAVYPENEVGPINLDAALDTRYDDTLVYACGPAGLLQAIEERTSAWPAGTVHMERFEPKELEPVSSTESFEVELADSGTVLEVPPDKSVLHVLLDAGVDVYSSCQDGTCGTCETTVLAGEVEHRDSIMTPEEQAANDRMYICVSRAACARLVLDL